MSQKCEIIGYLYPLTPRLWNRVKEAHNESQGSQDEIDFDEVEYQSDVLNGKFVFNGKLDLLDMPVRWILKPVPPSQSQDIQSLLQSGSSLQSLVFSYADLNAVKPVVVTTIGSDKYYFEMILSLPQSWQRDMASV